MKRALLILLFLPLTAIGQDSTSLSAGVVVSDKISGIVTFSASTKGWNSFAINVQSSLLIGEKVDVWLQPSFSCQVDRWVLYTGYLYTPVTNEGFPILLLNWNFRQLSTHYSLNLSGGAYWDKSLRPMVKLIITHK